LIISNNGFFSVLAGSNELSRLRGLSVVIIDLSLTISELGLFSNGSGKFSTIGTFGGSPFWEGLGFSNPLFTCSIISSLPLLPFDTPWIVDILFLVCQTLIAGFLLNSQCLCFLHLLIKE